MQFFRDEPAVADDFRQTEVMARLDEALEVEQVILRLIARFPVVAVDDINTRVRAIYGRFDDCKVRVFVPLLIEKAARREIEVTLDRQPRQGILYKPDTAPQAAEARPDEVA
ncbi:three-helix bundle dimerization domain-containing protein [Gordonia sp. NPDC058843]|uniref:three-helix bundle dimerization domain-containing protein n=1 Tax=Gordonia sp. NPDC058843 TaxID=3346648 RepID=UPI0036B45CCF